MGRQHPLRATLITIAVLILLIALIGKMAQHGLLYYSFWVLGASVLLGIAILAVRRLLATQFQALLETPFVRRLGLTIILFAVYFAALYLGYPLLRDTLVSKLGLDETGVRLLVVLVPLLVASIFTFFHPAWEFAPGKVFLGAAVVSSVLLVLFLVSKWSEASRKDMPPGNAPAYTRGARFNLPELCPDPNFYRKLAVGETVDWGLGNREGCRVERFKIEKGEADVLLVYVSGKTERMRLGRNNRKIFPEERFVAVSLKALSPEVVYRAF